MDETAILMEKKNTSLIYIVYLYIVYHIDFFYYSIVQFPFQLI